MWFYIIRNNIEESIDLDTCNMGNTAWKSSRPAQRLVCRNKLLSEFHVEEFPQLSMSLNGPRI